MIILTDIKKIYNDNNLTKTPSVFDITLKLPETGLICIIGESGSGKTTLLNIIGLLEKQTSGQIIIDNNVITDCNEKQKASLRRRFFGYLFQENNLIPRLSIEENILLPFKFNNDFEKDFSLTDIAKHFRVQDLLSKNTNSTSGGEKQRCAILRAIMYSTKALICDEPTASLDADNANEVFKMLEEISQHRLVVVSVHDFYLAKLYADRIIIMNKGTIINDAPNHKHEKNKYKGILPSPITSDRKKGFIFEFVLKKIKYYLKETIIISIISALIITLGYVFLTIMTNGAYDGYVEQMKTHELEQFTIQKEVRKLDEVGNEIYSDVMKSKESYNDLYEEFSVLNIGKYKDIYNGTRIVYVNRLFDFTNYDIIGELPTNDYEILVSKSYYDDNFSGIFVSKEFDVFGKTMKISGLIDYGKRPTFSCQDREIEYDRLINTFIAYESTLTSMMNNTNSGLKVDGGMFLHSNWRGNITSNYIAQSKYYRTIEETVLVENEILITPEIAAEILGVTTLELQNNPVLRDALINQTFNYRNIYAINTLEDVLSIYTNMYDIFPNGVVIKGFVDNSFEMDNIYVSDEKYLEIRELATNNYFDGLLIFKSAGYRNIAKFVADNDMTFDSAMLNLSLEYERIIIENDLYGILMAICVIVFGAYLLIIMLYIRNRYLNDRHENAILISQGAQNIRILCIESIHIFIVSVVAMAIGILSGNLLVLFLNKAISSGGIYDYNVLITKPSVFAFIIIFCCLVSSVLIVFHNTISGKKSIAKRIQS